jgi:hypothetical protein
MHMIEAGRRRRAANVVLVLSEQWVTETTQSSWMERGITVRLGTWALACRMNTVKTANIAVSITSRRFVFRAEISFRTRFRLVESFTLAFTLNS